MTAKEHKALELRLHRIEGQVRGITRMIDEDRSTNDTLMQLRAIQSALTSVMGILARQHMMNEATTALTLKGPECRQQAIDNMITDMLRWYRP